jgi:S-DNA-T family DNA segregation ATPase FtsK/SpoIIIE
MVMDAVVREMDGRIVGLLASDRDKLDDFTADLPLLVVVMEEYPGLLGAAEAQDAAEGRKPAERLASRLQRNVRRLIQEGAKVGVRVILVAQRMDAATVGGAERSNLGARFTLRVDNADAVKMLHPNASLEQIATVSGFDPGTGLVEMPGIPLQRFKADYLDYGNYSRVVREASR